jgi:transposase
MSQPVRLPISFEIIKKTIPFCVIKTKKTTRVSPITKNEMMCNMLTQAIHNQLIFKYFLADTWFSSTDNMQFIQRKKKFFIFDMKDNRMTALSEKEQNKQHKEHWTRIDELNIPDNTPTKVWLKNLEFPVLLVKHVFKNKDESIGVRFLVSNDDFITLYKKRWSVEEYHKSLKQNTSLAESPTRKCKTQSNHIFASAYVKLEKIKLSSKLNHFAMKAQLYIDANKAAFKELLVLKKDNITVTA